MLFLPTILVLCTLPLLAICAEDYYKLLNVDRDATEREIKRAYRRLSKKYHPDKNPNDESAAQKFVEIAEAYETLNDPEVRRIYDQYGHDGVKQHQQGGGRQGQAHDPFDLFSRFFGGSGHFGHSGGGERRGQNMEVRVSVPLRDFYTGGTSEFTVEKQAVCSACEGSGSADGQVEKCTTCGGRGMRVQKRMLAPGMYQQVQSTCDACSGRGKVIKKPCTVCEGARVVREPETHKIHVERGMPRGVRLTYENEADESPDWVAGDLIVHLHETEAKLEEEDESLRLDGNFFRRRGRDLFWREILSLREAWLGDWQRNVTHLDGHVVKLGRKRGEVVQPNLVEVIAGEGMPVWENEKKDDDPDFGALHVEYVVVLPDQMESGMEKEFWGVWEKWRKKKGTDLHKDSGRPEPKLRVPNHGEL